ncbi:MAG: glucose-6-phosphate dehydrogenase [Candidatus Promineifilaceae bacterium]
MSGTTSIVIFGASGDLTRRKLVPSLYNLHCKGRLPKRWQVVGFARTALNDDEFRADLKAGLQEFHPEDYVADIWDNFASRLRYLPGDLNKKGDFEKLDDLLADIEDDDAKPDNRVYYLALSPKLYEMTLERLGAAGMAAEADGFRRIVIEKPFGHDLTSALTLNKLVHKVFEENQVYRIDHYLGKETVQNILVFRFANSLFEPVWNRNYIHQVQISALESVDVGHRAGYYDGVGVVRDMVQNHLLQLLALVAMEPPASFEADAQRNEKIKLLSSIRPFTAEDVPDHTVRGQYQGYRRTEGVADDSQTPTYVALRLYVDNWRWQGVPFYLRSGKALKSKTTEISIMFRRPPHVMFPLPADMLIPPNDLSICIQPDEGIHFGFQVKVPDTLAEMRTVDMTFDYDQAFPGKDIPEAYERLLLDVIKGDPALFARADQIELAWGLVDKILAGWQLDDGPRLYSYKRGSWGPAAADRFIGQDGYAWSPGCEEHA